jgi:subtilisin family serine protease
MRLYGRDDAQGAFIAPWIADQYKGKKIAILHDKSAYGKGLATVVKDKLNGAGVTIAVVDSGVAQHPDQIVGVARGPAVVEDGMDVLGVLDERGHRVLHQRRFGCALSLEHVVGPPQQVVAVGGRDPEQVADHDDRQRGRDVLDEVAAALLADLVEEGVDLAIHNGELKDSSLIAQRIATTPVITVASPAYLKAHGEPASPALAAEAACGPTPAPSVQIVLATPAAFVTGAAGANDPPFGVAKLTVTPLTGLANASVTVTVSGAASAVPASAPCPFPLVSAMFAADC